LPEQAEKPVSLLLKIPSIPVIFPECLQVFCFVSPKIRSKKECKQSIKVREETNELGTVYCYCETCHRTGGKEIVIS